MDKWIKRPGVEICEQPRRPGELASMLGEEREDLGAWDRWPGILGAGRRVQGEPSAWRYGQGDLGVQQGRQDAHF
ncbi:unnamed protein product [Ilex paraguariensis]|uniref:Uncharacterized protein n=1 Tax=Ilex paraguariensis TaxID=185542 RepID=A0ABC8R891_9AQUA